MILRPGVERGIEKTRATSWASLRDRLAGIDGDLVGEGAKRGEDAGAAHHDPLAGLVHLFERYLAVDAVVGGDPPIHGGVDDGVGQRKIPLGDMTLKGSEVLGALFIAVGGPDARLAGEPCEG